MIRVGTGFGRRSWVSASVPWYLAMWVAMIAISVEIYIVFIKFMIMMTIYLVKTLTKAWISGARSFRTWSAARAAQSRARTAGSR